MVYSDDGDSGVIRYDDISEREISGRSEERQLKCLPETDAQKEEKINITRLLKKCCVPSMGMLRAGEFSPNHPDIALSSRPEGKRDVFVGLGLYEERRKELLHRRQKEYRDYLTQQRNMNALSKQTGRLSPDADLYRLPHHQVNQDHLKSFLSPAGGWQGEWGGEVARPGRRPSSVAVQTDPEDLMHLDRRLTQAERELSPRLPSDSTVQSRYSRPSQRGSQAQPRVSQAQPEDWRMLVEKVNIGTQNNLIVPSQSKYLPTPSQESAYGGDYFDAMNGIGKNVYRKDSPRARLLQDLRHTYMPSLFDEDVIKQRNIEIEQDAAAKRASYQMELKKQIEDQQRIREERKLREKMLEEAETRRLEEQLKLLKLAQDSEVEKQQQLTTRIRKDSNEFERRRLKLQGDIENERKAFRHVRNQPKPPESPHRATQSNPVSRTIPNNETQSRSNLPFYYSSPRLENKEAEPDILSYNLRRNNPHLGQDPPPKRVPFSTNIPDNSVFAQSIPVKNYNENIASTHYSNKRNNNDTKERKKLQNLEVDQRRIREDTDTFNSNMIKSTLNRNQRASYEPAFLNKSITEMIDMRNLAKPKKYETNLEDSLPIPVMREQEKNIRIQNEFLNEERDNSSEAMKNVEQKWKVPAVQKNILKNNFTEDGKQENILTQLGSIRRQLQLEQLKLDQSQMFPKQKLIH